MHMDKRITLIAAALIILTMIPIVGATPEPLGGARTYTKVVGISFTLLPHNYLHLKTMNALVVFYAIHEPFHATKTGVYLLQHVTFTGDFVGHVRHCVINGQFAGLPTLK